MFGYNCKAVAVAVAVVVYLYFGYILIIVVAVIGCVSYDNFERIILVFRHLCNYRVF